MKRLEFLRDKFNIKEFEDSDLEYQYTEDDVLELNESVFQKFINADPTKKKMYTQWILNVWVKMIKSESPDDDPERFVREDLPKLTESLELFDGNKRKKEFKRLAFANPALLGIKDPSNINQYDHLSQVYSVTFPFRDIDVSNLQMKMKSFVELGDAMIPMEDEDFMIYVPLTLKASELFSFTSWCTAKEGNTMHDHYTKQLEPDTRTRSKLYIVIHKDVFKGDSRLLYQVHFPSGQVMDKSDGRADHALRDEVIKKNIGVRNFFYIELTRLIKDEYKSPVTKNGSFAKSTYLNMALKLGLGGVLFSALDESIPSISFYNMGVIDVPDLSKYKKLRTLYLSGVGITELRDDMLSSKELRILSLPDNKITSIPKTISSLSNLMSINLRNNPIQEVCDEIRYLDPSMGGSLEVLAIDCTPGLMQKLTKLLPRVDIVETSTTQAV